MGEGLNSRYKEEISWFQPTGPKTQTKPSENIKNPLIFSISPTPVHIYEPYYLEESLENKSASDSVS